MTTKKHAINISIIMIVASLLIIIICWPSRDAGITELLYVLSTGVFGSSFATLWIFVYEYNHTKQELLKAIFDEAVAITENNGLRFLSRFGFHDPGIKESMTGKHYIAPVTSDTVENMDKYEKCHYELCRFVDGILDIGYDRISHVCDMVESIDFWCDSFHRNSKYRDAIVEKISLPLYEVFITAPAMENGYIFRYFKDFKNNHVYNADVIYPFVAELDMAMHGTGRNHKYSWQNSLDLRVHMHEKLWIFRDAFYSPHITHRQRRKAKRAFMKGTPYPNIR